MSDTTIRVGHHALYPVTSDDGKRMWASQPEPEAVANDVVFDSDLALIEAMASELASKPSDTTTEWPGEAGWYTFRFRHNADFIASGYWSGKYLYAGCNAPIGDASVSVNNCHDFRALVTASELATLQADCERWSREFARQADELVAVKRELDAAVQHHSHWTDKLIEALPDYARFSGDLLHSVLCAIEALKARLAEVEAERNCLMVTGGSTNPFVVAEAIQRLKERAEAAEARVKELEGQIDANVAAVIAKHRSRADLGMQKYGVATANSDLTKKQWLLHLQEELMDAAVYVEAALAKS